MLGATSHVRASAARSFKRWVRTRAANIVRSAVNHAVLLECLLSRIRLLTSERPVCLLTEIVWGPPPMCLVTASACVWCSISRNTSCRATVLQKSVSWQRTEWRLSTEARHQRASPPIPQSLWSFVLTFVFVYWCQAKGMLRKYMMVPVQIYLKLLLIYNNNFLQLPLLGCGLKYSLRYRKDS